MDHPAGFEPAASGFARRCSWSAELWVDIGSRRRLRTCLRRLTAGSPHRDGSTGMKWWSHGESNPTQQSCKDRPSSMTSPVTGAWSWFRANLPAFSARCFHQISFPGELVRTAGIEPAPPEWRSGTLPLSHVRIWWAGMESNHHSRGGAFTAPWARQCPACP
jgi:hypothetical protein